MMHRPSPGVSAQNGVTDNCLMMVIGLVRLFFDKATPDDYHLDGRQVFFV